MVTSSAVNDDDVSTAELKAFSDDDYYVEKWQRLQKGGSQFAGFNLYAAVFGTHWCFYRKMYFLGAVLFVAEFLLPVIIGVLYVVITGGHASDSSVFFAGALGTALITRLGFGFWANFAYFKKAVKVISKADSLNVSNEIYLNIIKSTGGISFPATIGSIAIYSAIRLLTQAIYGA